MTPPVTPDPQRPDTETEELRGTYACPICGLDRPHAHSDEQVVAHREDEVYRDGWTSTASRQPEERGWYLCLGVEIDPDQFGEKKDFWTPNYLWSQLSWFLWVRSGGRAGYSDSEIPEVLFYDRGNGGWRLRNLLGDAAVSGAESRRTVYATPKYWRDLPKVRKIRAESIGSSSP